MRLITGLVVAVVAILALTACGGSTGSSNPSSSAGGAGSSVKVGIAYDVAGKGDQSFNDQAATGLERAKKELGLGDTKELEATAGETEAKKEERLRLLASSGFNPVIAVGFPYAGPITKVAKEFPDVKFALVDDATALAPNISNLVFADEQGSFLVGAAAALKSKTDSIGFVGGVELPLIKRFAAGFEAGAKHVKPGVKLQTKYLSQPPDTTGFADPAKAKTAAQGMFDSGADVVYQASGGSGSGVFEAAKSADKWAIGVDSDQGLTASPDVRDHILTSMVKKVDVAVYAFIDSFVKHTVKSGPTMYDLSVSGLDYATTGGHVDDIKARLDELKKEIVDGKITIKTS